MANTESSLEKVYGTSAGDKAEWLKLLASLPAQLQDIHFHPDYLKIYEETYGHEARLFVYKTEENAIIQPFLVRAIEGCSEHTDITSVYGYGGPIATNPLCEHISVHVQNFERALTKWKKNEKVVSEYCLLHPFYTTPQRELLSPNIVVEKRKDVVILELDRPLHVIWSRMHKMQRRAANSARRKGVVVKMASLTNGKLNTFHKQYLQTMRNVGANEFWHFPETYFMNCAKYLGHENVTLLNARYNKKNIASVFLIHMYDTVYYHFSCSDLEYKNIKATSLLIVDSIIWAKSRGFKKFHFGGGLSAERDKLFNFKQSFSGATLELFGYNLISDKERYRSLSSAHAQSLGRDVKSIQFFPKYRG